MDNFTDRKDVIEAICRRADAIDTICNLSDAYESNVRPICRQMGITYTAFVILMYLANNPDKYTASDICKVKGIKPNLISFNVDKLVKEGFLLREAIPGDRRSVRLVCTRKAEPFIERGRSLNKEFLYSLTEGLSCEEVKNAVKYMDTMRENVVKMRKKSELDKID